MAALLDKAVICNRMLIKSISGFYVERIRNSTNLYVF